MLLPNGVDEHAGIEDDHALRVRGGIADVLSRAAGPTGHLGMRLDFSLPHGATGHYAFRIGVRAGGGFAVQEEECVIETTGEGLLPAYFRMRDGALDTNIGPLLFDVPETINTSNLFLPQGDDPTPFLATSVSNGTLRALGILVALFQLADSGRTMSLIGVEEPELYIHPGAVGVLLDALREASQRGQVLVTTHSPDLLDSKDIDASAILAVQTDERGLS